MALLALSSILNTVADGVIGTGLARRVMDGAAYALGTLCAFRTAHATVDVPQNALLA